MEKNFITERKQLLNSFLRNLAKFDFFTQSPEFALFTQSTGDRLQAQRKQLPKEPPSQRLQRYQKTLPIDLRKYEDSKLQQ